MKHVNELYDFKNESHYLIKERLAKRCKLVNISQKELAKEMDVDPSTLTNWIAGTRRANKTGISAKKLEKIAHILDVDPPYLIDQRYDNPHARRDSFKADLIRVEKNRRVFYDKYTHVVVMLNGMGFDVRVEGDITRIITRANGAQYRIDLKSWEYIEKKIKNHIEYELLNGAQEFESSVVMQSHNINS